MAKPTWVVPEINFMSARRRVRVLARRSSIHVSLPFDEKDNTPSKPNRTHLHCSDSSQGLVNISVEQILRIIPSYDRAIVVEFESPQHRDFGMEQIRSQKYCFGGVKVVNLKVKLFEDDRTTCNTMWSVYRSKKDHSYSVHEALRRFFCMGGAVPSRVRPLYSTVNPKVPKLTKAFPVFHRKSNLSPHQGASTCINRSTSVDGKTDTGRAREWKRFF